MEQTEENMDIWMRDSYCREQTVKEPMNGDTVVSTIDLQVQSIVEKYIQQFNDESIRIMRTAGEGSKNTAVMVMNPQNGEILAEASLSEL